MKTILLLGASHDQIYAIKIAKSMGLHVVVVDQNPNSPGFAFADDYYVISTRDVPALKQFVTNFTQKKSKIDGVLVMGSDIPDVVSELSKSLGTFSPSLESSILATNKFKMKQQFQKNKIPIPWFTLITSYDELQQIIREKGFPLVIKPLDSSGSRGVFLLNETHDILQLYKQTSSISSSGNILVEEYLSGLQISTETLMYDGIGYTVGFADRNYEFLKKFSPHIIENGGTIPTKVDDKQKNCIEILVENAALSLGISHGIVKGDIVLTSNGPVIIELAARLSGGDFSESLIPLGTGVNFVKEAISLSLGDAPNLESLKPKWSKIVVNRYFFPSPGILERIDGISEVLSKSWVKKLDFWYSPGDMIPEIKSHGDRFGVFILVGDDYIDIEKKIAWVYSKINIIVKKEI